MRSHMAILEKHPELTLIAGGSLESCVLSTEEWLGQHRPNGLDDGEVLLFVHVIGGQE